MWENENKKLIIRNIIIGIILIGVVFGLYKAIKTANEQISEEDKQLSEAHSNQQQQQVDARQENWDSVLAAYDKDMETVAQYMPGIVCWGDSLTAGSSGNASYPYTLQKYINVYLCGIYDFYSTVPNANNYPNVDWNEYNLTIPVVNMGGGQENGATILGRAGVEPYVIKEGFMIPADTEATEISIQSPDGKSVNPLTAGNLGINPVTINGIEGILSLETIYGTNHYTFERLEAGEETPVEKGTQIQTAGAEDYQDYIHIVWLGAYNGYTSPKELVAQTKLLLLRQTNCVDRYLVIGPCAMNGSWTGETSSSLDAFDSAMMQAFGNHYVNVRKYLIEDGLDDAELKPTMTDTQQINQGYVPTSFRGSGSGCDLNAKAYELIGKLIYERMDRLGYFDEVRKELEIDKTIREILLYQPKYFEVQLQVN